MALRLLIWRRSPAAQGIAFGLPELLQIDEGMLTKNLKLIRIVGQRGHAKIL
jgi:hypothetical protein